MELLIALVQLAAAVLALAAAVVGFLSATREATRQKERRRR